MKNQQAQALSAGGSTKLAGKPTVWRAASGPTANKLVGRLLGWPPLNAFFMSPCLKRKCSAELPERCLLDL